MENRRTQVGILLLACLAGCTVGAAPTTIPASGETTTTASAPTTTWAGPVTETTAPTTAPTTPPTTSVSTVRPPPTCRPDPFAGSADWMLAERYPGRQLTAHVLDLRTGCRYSLNPENRQNTASVFKVMVMAGTLLEAQRNGRPVTASEMERLVPMITESANWPVRSLWRSFGSSPWFRATGATFGLGETTITADGGSAWGATKTSAADQVWLLEQVLLGRGGLLRDEYRAVALDLMTSVVADQTWGVTAGVPAHWAVAQKNGFAGRIINSVGWVDPPGEEEGYLVAILTYGWPNHPSGIEAVETINLLVTAAMIDTVPGAR